jgi:hypothetical protein
MTSSGSCSTLVAGPWLAIAWACVLALPVVAWLFATVLTGSAKGARARRGASAVGRAALALVVLAGVIRLFTSLHSMTAGGPFAWLDLAGITAPPSSSSSSQPGGPPPIASAAVAPPAPSTAASRACQGEPSDVLLAMAALDGALLIALACLFARYGAPPARPFRVPLADGSVALLALAALAFPLGTHDPYRDQGRAAVLLDLAALVPILCGALAVWTRSAELHSEDAVSAPERAPERPLPAVDVPGLFRRAGAIAADARPLFASNGVTRRGVDGGVNATVWQHAGAMGDPPGALDVIGRAFTEPFQGWLVGDLPDPTERLFLAALLFRALQVEGIPCLIITEDRKSDAQGAVRSALRDILNEAIRASGAWTCGPLVVGERELREAIAGRRMPAAAFLDVGELSSQGLRVFSQTATEEGARWAASVGLVVVPRIDRGTALAVTHRMFTLRRLGLSLRAAGARWSVVATGLGGEGTRALVEQMFPGIPIRDQPFDPRASAPVSAWATLDSFRGKPGPPWARRVVELMVNAGLCTSITDPLGTLDLQAVELDAAKVRLARDVTFDGDASLAELDDAWFLASFRALANRVPLPNGAVHHSLWSFKRGPVIRFLLLKLMHLAGQGRVPSPRPLAGLGNRLIARAHLHAALREAEQDLESLRGMFGKVLVNEIAPADYVPERHVVRAVPNRDGLSRVPLAPSFDSKAADPLRDTVTENGARVMDRHGGRVLANVDWLVARTRYYPGRVFSVGSERYQVALEVSDAERREISVERVDAACPLTRPRVSVVLKDPDLIEPVIDVKKDLYEFRLATFDVTTIETVSGVVYADGKVTEYAPVSAHYRTRIRAFSFAGAVPREVLFHAARSLLGALAAHLLTAPDEIDVVVFHRDFHRDVETGFAVVDRHVQGIGVAEALDTTAALDALTWVKGVLASCTCTRGCAECSPPEVLAGQPEKLGVLRLLGA